MHHTTAPPRRCWHWQSQVTARTINIILGVALLCATSRIYIPLQPIPVTLQTLAVLLIGLKYTPSVAFKSVAIWLGLAACGLPVLAGSSAGIPVLIGPSGGYLFGCWVAAPLMAHLVQQKPQCHKGWPLLLIVLMGDGIILLCGTAWLTKFIGFTEAIHAGFVPFIFTESCKIFLLVGPLHFIRQKQ